MERRTPILVLLVMFVSLAGCSTIFSSSDSTPDSATTEAGPIVVSGEGDYAHDIRVDNNLHRTVTLTIQVENQFAKRVGIDDSVVYRESHAIPSQKDKVIAGFPDENLPEESRHLNISARDGIGGAVSVSVLISNCIGDIVFHYSNGKLDVRYSIC